MSILRVFHGLDRKVFLSPKLLGTTTNLEWHICAGKCRKYAKLDAQRQYVVIGSLALLILF